MDAHPTQAHIALNIPESSFALVALLGNRSRSRLARRALEGSSSRVLTGHGSVGGSGGTGGSRSSISCRVLVRERIEVLERHIEVS